MAGRASAGFVVRVTKRPQLLLLGRGQKLVFRVGVDLVFGGASVKFSLADQILLVVPSTLAKTTATATGRATAPPGPERGHRACFGRFSRLLCELEVHISFLHGGEGHIIRGGGKD